MHIHFSQSAKTLVFAAALAILCTGWLYSLNRRAPFLEEALRNDYWTRQTAHILSFARNWQQDGLFSSGCIMYSTPKNPAARTIQEREPYIRFPCGSPIPVYLVASAHGRSASLLDILTWNLTCQFATSLFVFLGCWKILEVAGVSSLANAFASLIAGLIYSLHHIPMMGHTIDYHATEAVIPFIALAVLLEAHIQIRRLRNIGTIELEILLLATLTVGCFMDWFMILFCGTILLSRLVVTPKTSLSKASSLLIAVPPIVAISVTIAQTVAMGHLDVLWAKFIQRTGISATSSGHPSVGLLKGFFDRALGIDVTFLLLLTILVVASILIVSTRFSTKMIDSKTKLTRLLCHMVTMILGSCLLHSIVLREHNAVHSDNALKYIVGFALAPFTILPMIIGTFLAAQKFTLETSLMRIDTTTEKDESKLLDAFIVVGSIFGLGLSLIPGHAKWQGNFVDLSQKIRNFDYKLRDSIERIPFRDSLIFSTSTSTTAAYDDLPISGNARNLIFKVESLRAIPNHPAMLRAEESGSNFRVFILHDKRSSSVPPESVASDFQADVFSENEDFITFMLRNSYPAENEK